LGEKKKTHTHTREHSQDKSPGPNWLLKSCPPKYRVGMLATQIQDTLHKNSLMKLGFKGLPKE